MSTENNYRHIVYSPDYLPHIYLIKNDNANSKWSVLSRAYTDLGLNFTIFESFSGSQVNVTNLKNNNIYTGDQMQNMKTITNKNDSYRIDCPDDDHTQIFYNGTIMSFNNFGDWCSYKVIWQQALNNNNYDILVMNGKVAPIDHLQFKDQLSDFMNSLPDSYDVGILYLNKIRTGTFTQVQDNELISIPSNNIRWNGIFASAFSNYGMQKMLDLPYFTNAKDLQILTEAKDNNLELYKSSLDLITLFEDSSINLAYPDPNITGYCMKDQLPVVFLVNLDRSTKRLESIDNYLKLADISYSRFSAIDGYQVTIKSNETNNICSGSYLKENKLKTKPNSTYQIDCNDLENTHFIFKGESMTAGQFGIWCSNLILWKNIITNNHEQAIIFQDDFSPSKQDSFKWNILNFTNSLPDTYDVAFMDFNYYVTRKRKTENINQYILKPIEEFMAWGMHAVVYSKKGIEKLLNYPYYSAAGDCFILDQANNKQLEVYISAIDFIRMKSFKSEIGTMGREMNDYEFFI